MRAAGLVIALAIAGCGDGELLNSGDERNGNSGAGGESGNGGFGDAGSGGTAGNAGTGGTAGSGGIAGSAGTGGGAGNATNGGSGGTPPPPDPGDEASANGNCNDGQDNDSDGFTDLEDVGCFDNIVASGAEARYHELCSSDANILGCGSGGFGTGSEPIQNNDIPTWLSLQSPVWNPSDSPAPSALGGDSSFGNNYHGTPAITRPLSTQPTQAQPGVRGTAVGQGHIAHLYTENICANNPARVCVRFYRAHTDVPENDCNVKTFYMHGDGPNKWWTIEDTGTFFGSFNTQGDGAPFGAGGGITQADCGGAGCRIEACFSGAICGTGDITAEAWITTLSDGVEHAWGANPSTYTWANRQARAGGNAGDGIDWITNNLWGDCVAGGDYEHENNYLMRADWSVNNGQRIGAAYEMEGQ